MTLTRPASVALVIALLFGMAAPARGDSVSDARRRQAEARATRARLAAKVDGARSSDRQLESAVRDLDAHIVSQAAATDAARQAADAAEQALSATRARLESTRQERDTLRAALRERAVAAYVNPSSGALLSQVLASRDMLEATRRRELLDEVMEDGRDVFERLRATALDLDEDEQDLAVQEELVSARRRQAEARLVALRYARSQKDRLRSALRSRISEWLAEADEVAKQEASLAEFIRTHSVPVRSTRPGTAVGKVSGAGLIWPVAGRVTSEYGMRWGRMHQGIDVGAATGTPIRAARSGTVVYSGYRGGYGNAVIIDHGGGFSTLYAHQSRRAVGGGEDVGRGEVIGYVGSTGHSTGPHLHFETRVNGAAQNPRRYLP